MYPGEVSHAPETKGESAACQDGVRSREPRQVFESLRPSESMNALEDFEWVIEA